MPLHFRCPCGVILNSPDGSEGRAAECPTCGKIIVIPQEAVSLAIADPEAASGGEGNGPGPAPEPAPAALGPSDDEVEPVPQALEEDSPGPQGVFGAAAAPPSEKRSPHWPLPEGDVRSEARPAAGPGAPGTGPPGVAGPEPRAGPQPSEAEHLEPPVEDRSAEPIEAAPPAGERLAPVELDERLAPLAADDKPDGTSSPLPMQSYETATSAEPVEAPAPLAPDDPLDETPKPLPMQSYETATSAEAVEAPPPEPSGPGPLAGVWPAGGAGRRADRAGVRQEAVRTQRRPTSRVPAGLGPRVSRSSTAVVRKRGRKALETLERVDSGEGAARRRSRRMPPKRRSKAKMFLVFILLLLLLGAGGLATLLFVPTDLIPPKYHERVDSLRSRLRDLGLPVKLLRESGDTPGEVDVEPTEPTGEGAGE